MRTFRHYPLMIVVLLFLVGCTLHYVPKSSTFKLDSIIEFSSKNTITLVNSQTSLDDVLFVAAIGHKFFGNLQGWTDVVIEITRRELTTRGMNVIEDAPKSLKFSVETIKGTIGLHNYSCKITLKVKTSDGYIKIYSGNNRSPADLKRAADGAVMRAVAEMLKDDKIIAYLIK